MRLPKGWRSPTFFSMNTLFMAGQESRPTGPRRVMVEIRGQEQDNGALTVTVRADCTWMDEVEQVVNGAVWGIDTACPNASQDDTATWRHPGPVYPAWRAVYRSLVWTGVLLREALLVSWRRYRGWGRG